MALNVCVLRSGGEYKPEHVARLRKMCLGLRFYCLSDIDVPCARIPLRHDWPGWWAKMELFAPWIEGDLMYYDLDTTIIKNPAVPTKTTVLRDFGDPRIMGSGMMFIKHEDKAAIWTDWMRDPASHMKACQKWPKLGDQGFLQSHIGNAQKWQDIAKVYSYKVHCKKGIPADAEIICYHGKPRPWDIEK